MSSQKIIGGSGFNEGAATVYSSRTGATSSLSSDLTRSAVPGEEYRYSTEPSFLSVSVGATTATLVSAVPGRQIEVLGYTLVANSATVVTWKSDSTALSGGMTFGANGGASANDNEVMLRTNIGEALNITNTVGTLNGHISYRIV
jgi:hypothetical protein